MKKIFGSAAAIYEKGDEVHFSHSVIRGNRKNDIELLESNDRLIDHASRASVAETFRTYLRDIVDVMNLQRRELDVAVPIVIGCPIDRDFANLEGNVQAAFPQYVRHGLGNILSSMAHTIGGYCIDQGMISKDDFTIEPRGFVTPPPVNYDVAKKTAEASEQWLKELIDKAKNDPAAREELKSAVAWIAERNLKAQISTTGAADFRFFLTGPKNVPGLSEKLLYNCFEGDEELRQIFANVLIRILGIDHNICLKCPRDPSSPPFSDVAATYIADAFDRLSSGQVLPAAVRVKRK